MATTKRRLRHSRRSGGLTDGERTELIVGFCFVGQTGFRNSEDMERAWFRHRDSLLAESRPFYRPQAYWHFEVIGLGGVPPDCAVNGYESERAALLRLKLPLTAQEKTILATEAANGRR